MHPRRQTCPLCKLVYATSDPTKKFCSDLCRTTYFNAHRATTRRTAPKVKKTETVNCLQCGDVFSRSHANTLYCSQKCSRDAHRRKRAEWYQNVGYALYSGVAIHRNCKECGTHFKISKVNKLYCSEICRFEADRKRREDYNVQPR